MLHKVFGDNLGHDLIGVVRACSPGRRREPLQGRTGRWARAFRRQAHVSFPCVFWKPRPKLPEKGESDYRGGGLKCSELPCSPQPQFLHLGQLVRRVLIPSTIACLTSRALRLPTGLCRSRSLSSRTASSPRSFTGPPTGP